MPRKKLTPEQARERLHEIMDDDSHPYHGHWDPKRRRGALDEVLELQRIAEGKPEESAPKIGPEEATEKLDAIFADPDHAYWNAGDLWPWERDKVMAEVADLVAAEGKGRAPERPGVAMNTNPASITTEE
ncbi:hypothetical protein [Lentisalinibacter orientalis]|uniref:hypothetical protein n=1 Tax=Lentisalinibacter orientalis TaxID=2992241 RepID=UPI00386D811D